MLAFSFAACKKCNNNSSSGSDPSGTSDVTQDPNHNFSYTETDNYLLKDGATEYKIVIPSSGVSTELSVARDELVRLFKEATGVTLQVVTDTGATCQVGLTGIYQLKNIATTLTALHVLRQNPAFRLPDAAIYEGLDRVVELTGLQGRWQTVRRHPRVVLDTGHNVAGIENVVRQLREQTCRTLRIVIGMVGDKDIDTVLTLLPREAVYYFTQARTARALPAAILQAKAASNHLHGTGYSTVAQAVQAALHDAAPDDFVFIGGSNFVVGEALEEVKGEK